MPCSSTTVFHFLLLKEAYLIQVERSGVLVSEIAELPIVNDFDFRLV